MQHIRTRLAVLLALLALAGPGCKKAGTFGPPEAPPEDKSRDRRADEKRSSSKTEKPTPLPADLAWMVPSAAQLKDLEPEVPIRFVDRVKEPEKWNKLDKFWTLVKTPRTPLAGASREVRIRVPLGVADPTPYVPAANPLTVGKWALGKKLFFDKTYLWPPTLAAQSCSNCHSPEHGFTEGLGTFVLMGKMRAPTLFNVVYNAHLFWDGRATALERVVQRSLEDEREALLADDRVKARSEARHVWGGVVKRLRANKDYDERFKKVFGTPPTQDNIGKALATYMRTILVGNSLFDQARLAGGRPVPLQDDYAKLLGPEALKALRRERAEKEKVAAEVFEGYRQFHGPAHCARCHDGPNWTDDRFHNAGIRESRTIDPAKPVGRFVQLPVGLKDLRMLGAFKTPTLRGLPKTGPYFHDGTAGIDKEEDGIIDAVMQHVKQVGDNPYLAVELRDLKVSEESVRALALFLRCLDGQVDPVVGDEDKWPEGARR